MDFKHYPVNGIKQVVSAFILATLLSHTGSKLSASESYIADKSVAGQTTAETYSNNYPYSEIPAGAFLVAAGENPVSPATRFTSPVSPATNAVNCNINDTPVLKATASYTDKNNLIQKKMQSLNQAIDRANSAGIDTGRETIAIKTTEYFLKFSNWDRQNQAELLNAVKQWKRLNSTSANTITKELPDAELNQLIEILDNALQTLRVACNQPGNRKKSELFSNFDMPTMRNGYFEKDNQRIYPWSMIWVPGSAAPYFSQFTSAHVNLVKLKSESTGITPRQKFNFKKELDKHSSDGQMLYLFLAHGRPPAWARKQYPEILQGARHFTKYDIDHPKIRQWWDMVLKELVPEFSRHPKSTGIYLLANEPHWFTAKNSWGTGIVSPYTYNKFKDWLKNKYTTIDALNTSWGKQYASFNQVNFTVPVANELKSTASWYDWMRFNMDRSSEWFQFLCNSIKKYDPAAMCSIKVVAGTLSEQKFERDHGIDREKISKLQAVNGVDTKLETRGGIGGSQTLGEYALHWQEMAFNYDFMKSVSPQTMIFDSEWHGFSNVHWRHLDLPMDYIHSALWLSHLYGQGMTEAWYWARNKNGSIKKRSINGFVGSMLTQPRMLNSYAQTMLEINNYSAEVEALLEQPRDIHILYAEEAAIQTPNYIKDIGNIHEAASFLGLPIGFKTASELHSANNTELKAINVLLVPAVTHASDKTVAAVKRYQDEGGQVIFIGTTIFAKNELGVTRNKSDITELSTAKILNLADNNSLLKKLEKELAAHLPAISCLGNDNLRARGVICRTAKLDGKDILAVVSVASRPQSVSIRRDNLIPASIIDRMTTQKIAPDLNLDPLQFKLLTVN